MKDEEKFKNTNSYLSGGMGKEIAVKHGVYTFIRKLTRKDKAVSSVISTLLLLSMSMSFFALLYYIAFAEISPTPRAPSFDAIATLEGENLIIIHKGGEPINTDAEIIVRVGNVPMTGIIENYLDSAAVENGLWDVGEKLIFNVGPVSNERIDVMIIDTRSNKLVLKLDIEVD